ncbi:MAG: hypothetical protein ACRCXT_13895, partial [Paraclostridium sp.]
SVPVIRALAKNIILSLNIKNKLNDMDQLEIENSSTIQKYKFTEDETIVKNIIQEEKNLKISDQKFFQNLKAYDILKQLIQLKLSNSQINSLLETLLMFKDNDISNFENNFEKIYALDKSVRKLERKEIIKNIFLENISSSDDLNLLILLLNIIFLKDYILELSKLYEKKYTMDVSSNSSNILSLKYDRANLYKPYSLRVAGSLLIKYAFLLEDKESLKGTLLGEVLENNKLLKTSDIDADILLQIIFNESASQSAKSTGGSSYEERVLKFLVSRGFKLLGKMHDSKNSAVEYDDVIELPSKHKIGISMKRTLRERYKQNHENIEDLEVDLMLLITLGTDLNKHKLKNIVNKNGIIVFVADDVFSELDIKNNEAYYKINDLSIEFLENKVKGK